MGNTLRHEYKFLISIESALLLKLRLPHIMKRDTHAGERGRYTIRSLYFDDIERHAFMDKVNGVDHRIKYRIRCYNEDPSLLRLEKKEKHGELTKKTGETVSIEEVELLQNAPISLTKKREGSLLEELRMQCAGGGMRPMVLVDYDRTPFVCSDGNTRITLDESLRTRPYCKDIFSPYHPMIPVMEHDQVVLEVKFDDFFPGYLNDALADIPKTPMAISKFAMCLNLY